jgi:short-subunit dehydrogenase
MGLTLASLDQQVIVITGASSGIGLVTARMAAKRGAKVVLAARNDGALEELAAEIRAAGGEAIAVGADVGDPSEVARIADRALEHFGRFDTWVNNAGVSIFGRIEEVSIEDMRRMFDTVYWGVVYGSLQAAAHYKRRGTPGAIVNVGSLFGDRATPLQSTYASAKHAVHGFTEALRMELEAEDAPVSVSLLHPGRIDTPYNEHAQSYADRHPVHRVYVYTPETVAEAILYAAEHPARDLYIGSQAKALAIIGRLAPRLTDKAMERYMYWGQQDPDRPSPPREQSGLHQAGREPLRERGSHRGIRRRRSLYLSGQEHRRARDAALAGVASAAAVALARRRAK